MIQIRVNSEMFAYDMYHIMKAFFPGEQIKQTVDISSVNAVEIVIGDETFAIVAEEIAPLADRKEKKRYQQRTGLCYYCCG